MNDTSNDGAGSDGTIPESEDGLAVTVGGASHFNPEEDEVARADADDDASEAEPGAGVVTEG